MGPLKGMPDSASAAEAPSRDRKSTRLNSSHSQISYAVFCLKKKKEKVTGPYAAHLVLFILRLQLAVGGRFRRHTHSHCAGLPSRLVQAQLCLRHECRPTPI